ncbi:TIGR04283 family arsenosugar biosynthesis glycosyltransferase [Bacterioplanoides sp.]|uniref:TIGR04283 family arsenosugar biosynthesis glycosyltransferase n=1 Tax=Bacterioplanoides sp. TaxID=2066072 RepID=UPI003B007EF9
MLNAEGGSRPLVSLATSISVSDSIDVSVVVPFYNEQAEMPALLAHLRHWQSRGCEILLVDGGSQDDSAHIAQQHGFKVIQSDKGRALQMNAGAQQASGKVLVFLHADSRLPTDADQQILQAIEQQYYRWGRFNLTIDGQAKMFPVISWLINQRSRLTSVATGDQAIFVRRDEFLRLGGYPQQPLMEDVELCLRLKQYSRPACLTSRVSTSGRRWQQQGVWRTIFLMWRLRWLYWRGVSATTLAEYY